MAKEFHKFGGHGHNPTLSTSADTFWSTDPYQVGNGEYQSVKPGIYGPKLTLNFSKGNNSQGSGAKTQTAYLSMDYESACIVMRTLDYIERTRRECFKHGVEYPIWSFKNTLQFTDKESKSLRTLGVFEIRTDISPVTQKNTVYISYTTGPDKFEVALGSMYLKDQCEFSDQCDFDVNDSRFYAFVDLFKSTILTWMLIMQQQKIFGITMSNFNAIRTKMGIPAKSAGGNGKDGNYTDSNYSTAGSDAGSDFDGPAGDLSDLTSDEPF